MTTELEKPDIAFICHLPWGTHFCHFCKSKEDLLDILIPYFKTGLENNEFCLWVIPDPLDEEEARKALRQAIPNAERRMTRGDIEIIFYPKPYYNNAPSASRRTLDVLQEKLTTALANGYSGMRTNNPVGWLTKQEETDFAEYEKELNTVIANQPLIMLCTYPFRPQSTTAVFDLLQAHQFAITKQQESWRVTEALGKMLASAKFRKLNREFEPRLDKRTRGLATTNKELRAEMIERQRAKDALRQSEALNQAVLNSLIANIAVLDKEGRIIAVNEAWKRFSHENGGSMISDGPGVNYLDVCRKAAVQREPQAEEALAGIRAVLAGTQLTFTLEYPCHSPQEERWFLMTVTPLHKEYGGAVISHSEITSRRKMEHVLRESEERFRIMADGTPVLMWVTDSQGRVEFVNRAYTEYFGIAKEVVQAEGWQPLGHPDDVAATTKSFMAALHNHQSYQGQIRVRRADGEWRWIESFGQPRFSSTGEFLGMAGSSLDITDRKLAESSLQATSDELRALSARLNSVKEEEGARIARELHDELGATLSNLKWELASIERAGAGPEGLKNFPAWGEKIKGMKSLIDATINTIRRISSELRPSILDNFGLIAALEWQAQQFETRTGIICQFSSTLEQVNLNREQVIAVFRIFQEALTNILRHSQANLVKVWIEESRGNFVLGIRDNGRGITEEEKNCPRSLGLIGMRERAHLTGGRIRLTGVAGVGTALVLQVPFDN